MFTSLLTACTHMPMQLYLCACQQGGSDKTFTRTQLIGLECVCVGGGIIMRNIMRLAEGISLVKPMKGNIFLTVNL